jgi:hypothetical protein
LSHKSRELSRGIYPARGEGNSSSGRSVHHGDELLLRFCPCASCARENEERRWSEAFLTPENILIEFQIPFPMSRYIFKPLAITVPEWHQKRNVKEEQQLFIQLGNERDFFIELIQ